MPGNHAFLSPSSSVRWYFCPPSAHLCKQYPDQGSVYAAEGTEAHALCEFLLKHALGQACVDPRPSLQYYAEEMEEAAQGYARYILGKVEKYGYMYEVIYQALCACFGLQPASTEASVLIREAYQEPENAPRPPRSTDVIYYSVSPDVSAQEAPPAYSAENPAAASHTPTVSSFSAWTLQVIAYGPHALLNARKIRAFLFVDGPGFPRAILRKAGIRPVPDPPEPLLLHEPEGSLWRERADLTIRLRMSESQVHPARRNAITIAPAVRIARG